LIENKVSEPLYEDPIERSIKIASKLNVELEESDF
jgi:hypothetical protein